MRTDPAENGGGHAPIVVRKVTKGRILDGVVGSALKPERGEVRPPPARGWTWCGLTGSVFGVAMRKSGPGLWQGVAV